MPFHIIAFLYARSPFSNSQFYNTNMPTELNTRPEGNNSKI